MVNKMNGDSVDITAQNIARLKELFPEVLTDGEKINFDMLKTVLGEVVETEHERYQFTWHGKKKMIEGAQKPSKGTLRPVPEKSKNFDTTENLYIEGDNLEVLKLLQKSYNGKIKMIYIDPPYNTGKDFIYKDNFKDGVQNYLEQTGQVDAEGNVFSTNTESNGRFHTDWLNMIYSRLKISRNLLQDDGLIIIHIDEHEIDNLLKITKEIYGEKNELGIIIWNKLNPKGDARGVSNQNEYIILFCKNKEQFLANNVMQKEKANAVKILKKAESLFKLLGTKTVPKSIVSLGKKYGFSAADFSKFEIEYTLEMINREFSIWISEQKGFSGGEKAYSNIDEFGEVYQPVSMAWPNNTKAPDEYFIPLIHPVTQKPCPVPAKGWRNPKKTMEKLLEENKILFGVDETTQPRRKYLLKENMMDNINSVLSFGGTDDAFFKDVNLKFDNPKPVQLVKDFIKSFVKPHEIVLDYFSGSATTAHATMQMNAEDGGNRKFIMVQLPEALDENSEAYKEGYRTICNIGEERIRQAGENIKAELLEKNKNAGILDDNFQDPIALDIGFKVLKLDVSNIREWNVDFLNLEDELDLYETPFIDGRSELDIVYEIMLKQGLELTYPIETFEVNGKMIYDIAFGSLFICLAKGITTDIARAIISRRDELGTETSSVIFSDAGFNNDSEKLNCIEILKDAGYPEDNFLTI
ncbi:site-specific DNA-methyltransferase [Lysinibacillus sp. IITD104]|uniref:site-specific DNA-methyltransferase n=1 Tax=Lysinibacillus sp. IITD104 TaxID=3116650 RepID=UPI002FD43E4A